jgi:uncharacterized membrane protein YkvA (DUF1232 family)
VETFWFESRRRGSAAGTRRRALIGGIVKLLFRVGALRALFGAGRLSWRLVRDPRVPLLPKLILAVGLVLIVSPINWVPNFVPVVGQMEDLALLALMLNLFLKSVPSDLLSEHEAAITMNWH